MTQFMIEECSFEGITNIFFQGSHRGSHHQHWALQCKDWSGYCLNCTVFTNQRNVSQRKDASTILVYKRLTSPFIPSFDSIYDAQLLARCKNVNDLLFFIKNVLFIYSQIQSDCDISSFRIILAFTGKSNICVIRNQLQQILDFHKGLRLCAL